MNEQQKTYRMTQQRKLILEVLRSVYTHPTADEVYEMVRQKLPKISLGTVYRNLEKLSEAGEILKLDLGCGQRHYDGDISQHFHIRCVRCGKVDDIFTTKAAFLEEHIERMTNYRLTGHTLELKGICPVCQAKEKTTPTSL